MGSSDCSKRETPSEVIDVDEWSRSKRRRTLGIKKIKRTQEESRHRRNTIGNSGLPIVIDLDDSEDYQNSNLSTKVQLALARNVQAQIKSSDDECRNFGESQTGPKKRDPSPTSFPNQGGFPISAKKVQIGSKDSKSKSSSLQKSQDIKRFGNKGLTWPLSAHKPLQMVTRYSGEMPPPMPAKLEARHLSSELLLIPEIPSLQLNSPANFSSTSGPLHSMVISPLINEKSVVRSRNLDLHEKQQVQQSTIDLQVELEKANNEKAHCLKELSHTISKLNEEKRFLTADVEMTRRQIKERSEELATSSKEVKRLSQRLHSIMTEKDSEIEDLKSNLHEKNLILKTLQIDERVLLKKVSDYDRQLDDLLEILTNGRTFQGPIHARFTESKVRNIVNALFVVRNNSATTTSLMIEKLGLNHQIVQWKNRSEELQRLVVLKDRAIKDEVNHRRNQNEIIDLLRTRLEGMQKSFLESEEMKEGLSTYLDSLIHYILTGSQVPSGTYRNHQELCQLISKLREADWGLKNLYSVLINRNEKRTTAQQIDDIRMEWHRLCNQVSDIEKLINYVTGLSAESPTSEPARVISKHFDCVKLAYLEKRQEIEKMDTSLRSLRFKLLEMCKCRSDEARNITVGFTLAVQATHNLRECLNEQAGRQKASEFALKALSKKNNLDRIYREVRDTHEQNKILGDQVARFRERFVVMNKQIWSQYDDFEEAVNSGKKVSADQILNALSQPRKSYERLTAKIEKARRVDDFRNRLRQ
ncbi:hypothetical protein NEOLI_003336 [Neolecta irregularis DAH-3]|uniref:Uncharacterized protein n=1 Tax=Neolecta irregularis (strain DAH-3) TaxID=1198029 RepID=A0A1U7LW56_NEOID|nr:hypothetical protein NEOLI_003336 [Neolecta irregularis DAH-3]|eukprot:OLL26782.1 hypothetical protein NEOLI_003336 [Neolecta irregularis DAH-3]